jgi:hypothetical protein
MITQVVSQNTPYSDGQYSQSGVNCNTENASGIRDWGYRVHTHGAFNNEYTVYCSKEDTTLCGSGDSNLSGALSSVTWASPGDEGSKRPTVNCNYDATKLTGSAALAFYNRFGNGNASFNTAMRTLCQQPATSNSQCNDVSRPCSKFTASGPDCDVCRALFPAAGAERDSMVKSLCADYPGLQDCACINRTNDPMYNVVKPTMPFIDGCWYAPCANTATNLVPTDVVASNCPSNICGNLIGAITNNTITNTAQLQNTVTCDIKNVNNISPTTLDPGSSKVPPSTNPPNVPSNVPPSTTPGSGTPSTINANTGTDTGSKNNTTMIILAGGVVVVAIAVFMFLKLRRS